MNTKMPTDDILSVISQLANGINPIDGTLLPRECFLHHPDAVRALFSLLSKSVPEKVNTTSKQPNAGIRWTTEEESKMVEAFEAGIKVSKIAKEHGRSVGGIRSRLIKLGLVVE